MPATHHCLVEDDQAKGAVVIAISVGTFSLLLLAAWGFAYLMGWLS